MLRYLQIIFACVTRGTPLVISKNLVKVQGTIQGEPVELTLNEELVNSWLIAPFTLGVHLGESSIALGTHVSLPLSVKRGRVMDGEIAASAQSPLSLQLSPFAITIPESGETKLESKIPKHACPDSSFNALRNSQWKTTVSEIKIFAYGTASLPVLIKEEEPTVAFSFSADFISVPSAAFRFIKEMETNRDFRAVLPTFEISLTFDHPPVLITPSMYVGAARTSPIVESLTSEWTFGLAFLKGHRIEFDRAGNRIGVCKMSEPSKPTVKHGWMADLISSFRHRRFGNSESD